MPFVPASSASPVGASGLRPAAFFVGLAVVFTLVATRSLWIQVFAAGDQPDATRTETAPTPGFTILDRAGRPLALSVECFDVTVSPRSLWRAHTPERIARALTEVLGSTEGAAPDEDWTPARVLRRTMPEALTAEGPYPGRLVPEEPRLLRFDDVTAERVVDWLDTGVTDPLNEDHRAPVRGLALVPLGERDEDGRATAWTLAMDPVAALGREARVDQFGTWEAADGSERTATPERWTRRLLDALITLVGREEILDRFSAADRTALASRPRSEVTERLRDAVWAELMPTRFRVLARAVDPVRAHALRELMGEEGISSYQIALAPRVERRHPTRPGGLPVAPHVDQPAFARADDAFTLLGHWGVLDVDRANERATRDREQRPHVLPWEDEADPFAAYAHSLVVDRRPWSGVELLCQTTLENGPWAPLARDIHGRSYQRRVRHLARDRRRAWSEGVPDYFSSTVAGTDVPRIGVTLDAALQEVVHAELGRLMDEHLPALAMAIVVDIQTGDVLGLDSRSLHGYSGFAPVRHEFTPGSTFKAVIMALALEAGVTTPGTMYKTYRGAGIRLGARTIKEAEGAPTDDEISAADGLAHSCNAVLVQIALEMEAAALRAALLTLGYGQTPGAGLGPERPGYLRELDRGTWVRNQTHASVGFGHELTVTLWQHATALATILRGGERRPLRLLRSVQRDERQWDAELEDGTRVLSERTCAQVREMMAMGAEFGTGDGVAKREDNPEFSWIGTKTGTTEKVETELCVHLELAALARVALTGEAWTKAKRRALFALERPHGTRSCYTSSMCAAGRAVDANGEEREIMVLVVADDATGSERFGSRVSGPTAMAILRQAFGFPRQAGEVAEAPRRREPAPRTTGARLFERGGEGRTIDASYDAGWLNGPAPWEHRDDEGARR